MSAVGDQKLNKARKQRRYTQEASYDADWASIDPELLRSTIAAVARSGCAIRFGYSRDGGAFAIGIVGDGDPYTVWGSNAEATEEKLADLRKAFQDD
jgi:hypothetical protein